MQITFKLYCIYKNKNNNIIYNIIINDKLYILYLLLLYIIYIILIYNYTLYNIY